MTVRTVTLDLLGHRVLVRCDDPRFLGVVAACFEMDSKPGERTLSPGGTSTSVGDEAEADEECVIFDLRRMTETAGSRTPRLALTTDPPRCRDEFGFAQISDPGHFVSTLTQWIVNRSRGHHVFHAGSVSSNGRGILLPAGPHSGKSTLTAGLIRRGFEFLSDEVGAFSRSSKRQVPYARALSLRPDVLGVLGLRADVGVGLRGEGARMVPAHALGGRCTRDAQVALIVFPRYVAGARTDFEPVLSGAAAVAILQNACFTEEAKLSGLDFVVELAVSTPCYELRYSDLDSARRKIERVFAEITGSRPAPA